MTERYSIARDAAHPKRPFVVQDNELGCVVSRHRFREGAERRIRTDLRWEAKQNAGTLIRVADLTL